MEETRMKRRRINVKTEQYPQNCALTKDRWYNGVSKTILDVYHSRTIHRILMAAETARGRRGNRRKLWLRLRLYKKCIESGKEDLELQRFPRN